MNNDYYEIYTIKSGDNLYSIGKKYNINPALLSALNGLNDDDYIYPNQEILIPKSGYSYYISTNGDTLDMVANKFNTNIGDVVESNTIYLLPGQLLIHKN
ncbi:MAG: LysM peptidoglycan-binding domain-containing protein [Bacilli bacterium]|nr:LysM peptidoglycan-binding domain-containing protein [Bacilli bacterium]